MNQKVKNLLIVVGAVAVSLFMITPLQAYVLQGRHVLDLMIEKLGPSESLFVSERLFHYPVATLTDEQGPETANPDLPSGDFAGLEDLSNQQIGRYPEQAEQEALEFESTLRYVFSRAFRSDARSADSEHIHISVDGRTLTIIDNNIVPDVVNRFDFFKDILLYRSRETLADRLLQLGVDLSITTLGRFEDKIAFVLGAKYPDETANQLWIDKDTLLLIRLIIRGVYGADNTDKVEIRYLVWWKIGETLYPSKMEFYQDENLVRATQAQSFEENALFSEELFDIEYLETVYPQAAMQPIPAEVVEEPSEVQKTIEEFKRIFE